MCVHWAPCPPEQCAICQHTVNVKPEFHPMGEDDQPRLVKGRDKTEWRGRGRSTGSTGSDSMNRAYRGGNMRGVIHDMPLSDWGVDSVINSVGELAKIVRANPPTFKIKDLTPSAPRLVKAQSPTCCKCDGSPTCGGTGLINGLTCMYCGGTGTRLKAERVAADRLPKNRNPRIPDGVEPSRWNIHHASGDRPNPHLTESERHVRHARNPGRTTTVAHFRSRT